jgi:hypothetical protein
VEGGTYVDAAASAVLSILLRHKHLKLELLGLKLV